MNEQTPLFPSFEIVKPFTFPTQPYEYKVCDISGDATPSEADIKVTRDLIRAGQLLKIEILDHVVMGNPLHSSLRELGYFA